MRPAIGAEEGEVADRRIEAVGGLGGDRAGADLLGTHGEPHRRARAERGGIGDEQVELANAHPARPGDDGIEEGHVADEIGDEGRARTAVDLLGRADLLDGAVAHHDDAVGHGERFLLVVGDHDGGHAQALLQGAHLVAQPDPDLGVERRERLVEQQQLRGSRERAGQSDALLLAARELDRVFLALLGQADEREQLFDAPVDLGRWPTAVDQAIADIVGDRQVREQRIGLEDDAEIALGRARMGDVTPAHLDAAAVLQVEAGDCAQQGGLAAARRAEEADELAAMDVEIDAAQGLEGAEALGELADRDKRSRVRAHLADLL